MKIIYVFIFCMVLLGFLTQSCSKMNDLHQKYLDEGEIIYASKVDSVASRGGKGRIELEMFIQSQRIEKVRIYWNDYKDSLDVQNKGRTDSTTMLISNLTEKGYIFEFISFDIYGHKSLPFEVTGNVYGDRFQAGLSNRILKSQTALVAGKITFTWSGAADKEKYTELVYTNTSGVEVTKIVLLTETTTILTDAASGIKFRTVFIPEKYAIDLFYGNYKVIL